MERAKKASIASKAKAPNRKKTKGGPSGANQGGASRGGSRVEPSHLREIQKKDRVK